MSENSSLDTERVSRAPTLEEERERLVPVIKEFRQEIDALIQRVPRSYGERLKVSNAIWVNAFPVQEARDQVRNNLTNAKMWAGKMLEFLGNPFPAELADKANVQ
jgi:hypothetical protein